MTAIAWADPLICDDGMLRYGWGCPRCQAFGLARTGDAANRQGDAHLAMCPKQEGDGT